MVALGYLVNRTGNQKALTYLVWGARPKAWAKRGLRWQSPSATSRDEDMSTSAILGLALSARPEAAKALHDLQSEETDNQAIRGSVVNPALGLALAEHVKVRRKGLAAYAKGR